MRKRLLSVTLLGAAVAVLSTVAASAGGVFKASGRAVTPLPSSSCSGIVGPKNAKLLIASDLPLQVATRPQTIQMTKAIGFVLKQHHYKAGKYTVAYQSCDDSTAALAKWDPSKCTANAGAYAGNSAVAAVIGTFNSGCAKLEIPIANRAHLLMVSPANTWPGLTHKGPVLNPGEPGIYYPTGTRNYARVVATDDFQAPADAMMTKFLKIKKVYVLDDNETYGKGIAELYIKAAPKLGITVIDPGGEVWDAKATSYTALGDKIKASGAQAVFFGGIICNNGAKLLKDIRASVGPKVVFQGPDGWTPFSALTAAGPEASNGMYVSVAGPPLNKLGPAGKKFVAAFKKATHASQIAPYATYAAQAAQVVLASIAKSNGTRASITSHIFGMKVKNGVMGNFTIDKNGDTSLKGIEIYKVKNGNGNPFHTFFPPVSLTK